MTGYIGAEGSIGQRAPVFCWCGVYMVEATLADIRNGLTNPCKLRDCIVIDNQKRRKP